MTWRDELNTVTLPNGRKLIGGSFRGATFLVEVVELSTGRRAVVHEFPLRDAPYVEDLGRVARGYRVDAYVLGDDYLAQRDALLTALDGVEGPGSLLLPYYPVIRAICTKATARESTAEGGIARVSMEFAETPNQAPTPTEVVDGPEQVDALADDALDAVDAELVEQYDAEGLPGFAFASVETAITDAAESMESALGPIVTETQELATLASRIEILTAQAAALVRDPASIVSSFHEVIEGLVETIADAPGAVMTALFSAYFADLGPEVVATTATRERELANQAALTRTLRLVFAIEAARIAPNVPYASIDEALAARDQVAAMLEEQAATAGDTAYPALVNLRSEVLRAVPGGNAFARVVTETCKVPTPSLVLAYKFYGSVDRESDIVARNSIQHPGFVFGDIKVLSDG